MQNNVLFPYGISNFGKVVQEGLIFVDKTHYLPLLEQRSNAVYLRPRRFGKSLFVSMLENYYDIRRKEQFFELFGKFYIGSNPTPLANSFRILHFNFSGINTENLSSSKEGFDNRVRAQVNNFMGKYQIFTQEQRNKILDLSGAEKILANFFYEYEISEKIPIYLIIDEYDHFTNEILTRDVREFQESVSLNGYVRKFYEVIKNATQQGVMDRFFITGVSPITMDSLTSGFNIVQHLTHEEDFEAMMGFSEMEVRSLLNLVLWDKNRENKIMQDLKYFYNGYKFYPFSQQSIYNADMILYFLDNFKKKQQYPLQILDPNIAPDYGKLKRLFETAKWIENTAVLEEILRKGEVQSELIYQFSFEKDFGEKEFINFLYYLGNLTIKEANIAGEIIFKIPNYVIGELYWQYYGYLLQKLHDLPLEEEKVRKAVVAMAFGNVKDYFEVVGRLLKLLSNRDYQRFDEKYIKMIFIAYAMQGNVFLIHTEREIAGGGYVDLELFVRPTNHHSHHQYAMEIKYLKKEQEHLLAETLSQAKKQLWQYFEQDEILQSKPMLHLLAVVVVKDEIYFEELVPTR